MDALDTGASRTTPPAAGDAPTTTAETAMSATSTRLAPPDAHRRAPTPQGGRATPRSSATRYPLPYHADRMVRRSGGFGEREIGEGGDAGPGVSSARAAVGGSTVSL